MSKAKIYNINIDGEIKSLKISEIASLLGITSDAYRSRIKRGKTPQEAFDEGKDPSIKRNELINGKCYTMHEAADLIGISYVQYKGRVKINLLKKYMMLEHI